MAEAGVRLQPDYCIHNDNRYFFLAKKLKIQYSINQKRTPTDFSGRQLMLSQIKECIQNNRIRWRQHALERMIERNISRSDIRKVVEQGEIIEVYAESTPYPGCLILGYAQKKPMHVVLSIDGEDRLAYVITAYVPDTTHFEDDLKTRKQGER